MRINPRWLNNHIIDLKHSEWDKEKSDPTKAFYVFKKKVYMDYKDKGKRPKWAFTWGPNSERGRVEYRTVEGWEVVKVNDPDCQYFPEGLAPSEKGEFVFMTDLVWMKRPLVADLEQRLENQRIANRGFKGVDQSFQGTLQRNADGPGMDGALKDQDKEGIEKTLDSLISKQNY